LDVLIDEHLEGETWLGRSYADAPEIDGNVIVTGPGIKLGDFIPVEIDARQDYDLVGTFAPEDAQD
jgi:ribosomal protein S12 methylthiotransferase